MLSLEQIRLQLNDRRLQMLADCIDVHYNTLRDIRDNPEANPTYRIVEKISNYLEADAAVQYREGSLPLVPHTKHVHLTEKQKAFARMVASGMPKVEAYREAYKDVEQSED